MKDSECLICNAVKSGNDEQVTGCNDGKTEDKHDSVTELECGEGTDNCVEKANPEMETGVDKEDRLKNGGGVEPPK